MGGCVGVGATLSTSMDVGAAVESGVSDKGTGWIGVAVGRSVNGGDVHMLVDGGASDIGSGWAALAAPEVGVSGVGGGKVIVVVDGGENGVANDCVGAVGEVGVRWEMGGG